MTILAATKESRYTESVQTTQVIGWDRGRPARNERKARKIDGYFKPSRLAALIAGGTPAVPANHLSGLFRLERRGWLEWLRSLNRHMNTQPLENDDAGPEGRAAKLQLIQVGSSQFGIFANEISAIVPWREPTPLPHAPSSVLGVVSIQGRMLTVIDLAALLLTDPAMSNGSSPAQLIALRGEEQLALAVEALGDPVLPFDDSIRDSIRDSIKNQETGSGSVLGVIQHEGREVRILNPRELFPAALQGRQRRKRQF